MKKLGIVIGLILLFAGGNVCGKVYTLDECIELAKKNDPQLMQFRSAIKTAKATVWTQMGLFLPSLYVYGTYGKTWQSATTVQVRDLGGGYVDTVPPQPAISYMNYRAGFSLDYTLFDGLRNVWGYLGSRDSKHRAEYDYANQVSDLAYIVKGEYYFVLKAKRDFDVAHEAVDRSEELLKLFEEKYELGSASLSDVLKQRVQFGNDQLTLVSKDKVYRIARAELALTIGIDPSTEFEIADIELRQEQVGEVADLIRRGTEFHPSLLATRAEVSASKYDVRYALGGYLPRVSLGYSKSWSQNTFDRIKKLGSFDNSRSLSVTISYNIFDQFSREYNLIRAKATLNNARASDFYAKNLVIKEIRDAYLGITVAEKTLRVTEEIERSAGEDMDLVRAKYDLGAAALWELLDAQVSLKEAQFNKVKAEFDYNLALAQLHNAIGE